MKTKRNIKLAIIAIVAAFILKNMWHAILQCLSSATQLVSRLDAVWLLLMLGLCIAYRIINAAGWTLSLRALGGQLSIARGTRIWLVSESCRWLPGSVWAYGSRAIQAKRAGVAANKGAAAIALELALTIASWAMIAAAGLLWDPTTRGALQETLPISGNMLLAITTVGVAGTAFAWRFCPASLSSRLNKFSALRGMHPSARGVTTNFLFFVTVNVFNGLIVAWFIRGAFGVDVPIVLVVAANAVAWLVGFFALFAPGGLIVREACLAAALSQFLSPVDAIAVATLIRGLHLLSEFACLPLVLVLAKTRLATPSNAAIAA